MKLIKADCVFSCWYCGRRVNGRTMPDRISSFMCQHCDCITQVELRKEADGITLVVRELEPKVTKYSRPRPKKVVRKVESYPPVVMEPEVCLPLKMNTEEIAQSIDENNTALERLKAEIEKMRKKK